MVMRSLLLCVLAVPLFAAEEVWLADNDLRVTLSALPRSYDSTLKNADTGFTVKDAGTFDSAGWLAIDFQMTTYRDSWASFVLGVGVDGIGINDENSLQKSTLGGVGAHLALGAAMRPSNFFSLEGAVVAGGGAAASAVESKTVNFTNDSDSGYYGMLGVLVRTVFTIQPGFQVFGQAGYIGMRFNTEYDSTTTSGSTTQEVTISGLTYGLGIGWRF